MKLLNRDACQKLVAAIPFPRELLPAEYHVLLEVAGRSTLAGESGPVSKEQISEILAAREQLAKCPIKLRISEAAILHWEAALEDMIQDAAKVKLAQLANLEEEWQDEDLEI